MHKLATPSLPNYNPGCLLDEHKRSDSIYLRTAFVSHHNSTQRKLTALLTDARLKATISRTKPSQAAQQAYTDAQTLYDKYYASLQESQKRNRFDQDLHLDERCTQEFLRPPIHTHLPTRLPLRTKQEYDDTAQKFRSYWAQIFQSPSRDIHCPRRTFNRSLLRSILAKTTSRLTITQRRAMEAPLTANDFYFALIKTAKNKAPGPDGLPVEYYLTDPHNW
ncbi:hypothetical protein DYB32_008276, partial [Aphanomyces invadans]